MATCFSTSILLISRFFDDIIKKVTSINTAFKKLYFKLILLVMSDKLAIIVCHSNNPIPLVVLKINERKAESESHPAGTTEHQKARFG